MATTTLIAVSFRCTCDNRVDVRAAVMAVAHGEHTVSSNGGRTEHEGRLTVPAEYRRRGYGRGSRSSRECGLGSGHELRGHDLEHPPGYGYALACDRISG